MDSFHTALRPFLVVRFLFWSLIFSGLVLAATDGSLHTTFRRYWRYMVIGIVVILAWRTPRSGKFFHGMEYEDAYVYTVAARQILERTQVSEPIATYLTNVCDVGSLDSCKSATTYSGHYIGSPYVFSLAARALGYRPAIAALVGLVASCITLLLVFCMGAMISDKPEVPISSAAVFAMTPVFAVYGIASYAEPLSNMCACIAVLGYIRYLHFHSSHRTTVPDIAALFTWTFALLFAIVVKRENLIIAFALPLASLALIALKAKSKPAWRRLVTLSLVSCMGVAFSIFPLRFGEVLINEAAEYHHMPFSLSQVSSLFPAFAIAFGTPSWYCFGVVWLLCGAVLAYRYDYLPLYPLLLILGYLGLYLSHIRSYYQLNYGEVEPADALRYSMNFMAMWAILAGVGLSFALNIILSRKMSRRWPSATLVAVSTALVIYAAVAFWDTRILRDLVVGEEQDRRIEPAVVAARIAARMGVARTYVLTPEPLLVQIYGPPNIKVIDMTQISAQLITSLSADDSGFKLLYIDHETYRNEIDRNRYKEQLDFLKRFTRDSVYRGDQFEILKLKPPSS